MYLRNKFSSLATSRWEKFSYELSRLIRFWLFGVLSLSLFRLVFILFFGEEIKGSPAVLDYLKVFYTGFRFDAVAVSYFTVIPFAFLLFGSYFGCFKLIKIVRKTFEYLFIAITAILCMITINYYIEFQNIFDNNLFLGLFEEEQSAIVQMIWEYKHPIINLFIFSVLVFLAVKIFNLSKESLLLYTPLRTILNKKIRGIIVLLAIYGLVSGMRGSLGTSVLKVRNAAVSTDFFLNKAVLNPYKALDVAYKDYKEVNNLGDTNPFEQPLLADYLPCSNIKEYIKKEADSDCIEKPKQIFLVIMESYDAWSLLDKYRPFHVSDNLCRIADNGTTFMNFLPAYNATIYAYSSIVAGIPHFGVNISQISKQDEECVSSIFEHFKRLGYTTNLFYGGYLSWQKLDRFSAYLKCENAYSAPDIGKKMHEGCWGVEDEDLFEYVVKTIDSSEYTFNVILTTSYHPPFSIDVCSKGYPYKNIEDLPEEVRGYLGNTMSIHELGHRWYGDYAIGKFMDWAEKKYPEALYAFTGDHFARKFINSTPNLYESSAVPFILYGKHISAQKLNTPGSHIDIMPTLIDLVAPEGFKYYSFGSSMLQKNKFYGIGYNKLITKESLYHQTNDSIIIKMDYSTGDESPIDLCPYNLEYYETMGLAWQYTAKGNRRSVREKSVG